MHRLVWLVETVPLVRHYRTPTSTDATVHQTKAGLKHHRSTIQHLCVESFLQCRVLQCRASSTSSNLEPADSLIPQCPMNSFLGGKSHTTSDLQPLTLSQGNRPTEVAQPLLVRSVQYLCNPQSLAFTCNSLHSVNRKRIPCSPSDCAALVLLPPLLHEFLSAFTHSATRIRALRL